MERGGGDVVAGFAVWFVMGVVLCFINGSIAASKNRNVVGWVLLSLVFGLIATLILAVLPKVDDDGKWIVH